MKVKLIPIVVGAFGTALKGLEKEPGEIADQRKNRDHPNSGTFQIIWNSKKVKVKLATIVEGNPKAPFSIATTPRCRGGRYSFLE